MLTIKEIEQIAFVFILGRGRSGTSLLQTILDTHPNIISTHESPFILKLKKKYFSVKIWTSGLLDDFITDLYEDLQFYHFWKINPVELRKSINQYPIEQLNFSILCKLVYLNFPSPTKKENILLLVDKNPNYSLFINDLLEIFPDAKFIHLIRDYRDNIISCRKSFGEKDVALMAKLWVTFNETIDSFRKKMPSVFYRLRYEDLAEMPGKYVSEMCEFLQVKYDLKMLDFYKTTNKVFKENQDKVFDRIIGKIHLNLLNPINTEQINKWKKELTQKEIEIIDYIAGDYALEYHYIRTTHKKNLFYFFISLRKYIWIWITFKVTAIYYTMPVVIRVVLKKIFEKLNSWFGYYNRFNKDKFTYKKDTP